jgi:hypothetical protein
MVNIDDFTVLCIGTEAEIVFLCSLLYRAGTGQAVLCGSFGYSRSFVFYSAPPSSGVSPRRFCHLMESKFYEILSYIKYIKPNPLHDTCICINFEAHVTRKVVSYIFCGGLDLIKFASLSHHAVPPVADISSCSSTSSIQ